MAVEPPPAPATHAPETGSGGSPQFLQVLDLLPIGAAIIDADYRVRYWNQRLAQWTGLPAEQVVGQTLGRHFPHLEQPRYKSRLDSVLSTGAPMVFSSQWHKHFFPARQANGNQQIQHTTATALADPEGGGFLAMLAVQDMSEMDRRIKEHRASYRSAMAEVRERKNTEAKLRARAEQQRVIAQLGHQALTEPKPKALAPKVCAMVTTAMELGHCEVWLQEDPGAPLTRLGSSDPAGPRELAAHEHCQAGRTLSSDLPQIVSDIQASSLYARAHPYVEHGFQSGLCVPIPGKLGPVGVLAVHAEEPREFNRDDINFCKSIANILAEAVQIEASDTALRGYTEDLVEAKSALETQAAELSRKSEELAQAWQFAEEANQSKSSFLAAMSHEIRTPMNAIIGYAELLEDEEVGIKERREYLKTIQSNSGHLLALVNDILDLSKIEAGHMELESIPLDPRALAREVVDMLKVQGARKGLDLGLDIHPEVPAQIIGDPTRLRQILLNLAGNAIKFTAEGSVRLSLERLDPATPDDPVTGAPPAPARLRCTITDTGIGMDEATVQRLFKPFSQGRTDTTRQFGGTGLGLTISRHFAELMAGDLQVESSPGTGSRFHLTIPLWSADDPIPAPRPRLPRSRTRKVVSKRILLAEDGPDNQRLISLILRKAGFEVTLAANGQEAVDASLQAQAGETPYALILMDMQMPVLDGLEATRQIRGAGMDLPILALTANAMAEDRERCLAAGCTEFCTKPINRKDLLQAIEDQLQLGRD